MAILLHIESTADFCSVALSKDDTLLDDTEGKEKNSHAQMLLPFIDALLANNNISRKELNAISISAGPGSYTGLRIGTATAKAICNALNIPLIAVSTLKALAVAAREKAAQHSIYVPMIDARRMEVYTAIFDKELNLVENETAKDYKAVNFDYPIGSCFFGNGAEKLQSEIAEAKGIYLKDIEFSAKHLILPAYEKFKLQDFESIPYFEPNYIKNFQLTLKK